jgi:hypothetical protein
VKEGYDAYRAGDAAGAYLRYRLAAEAGVRVAQVPAPAPAACRMAMATAVTHGAMATVTHGAMATVTHGAMATVTLAGLGSRRPTSPSYTSRPALARAPRPAPRCRPSRPRRRARVALHSSAADI